MARLFLYTILVFLFATVFAEDYLTRLKQTQSLLRSDGPSMKVLDEFDRLIQDLHSADSLEKSSLVTALYNRALVEISLNKMTSAIEDLETVLTLDPGSKPARDKFRDIMVKRGDFAAVKRVLGEKADPELLKQIASWEKSFNKLSGVLEGKMKKYDPDECLAVIEEELQPFTPDNPAVIELHLACNKKKAVQALGKDKKVSDDALTGVLADYSNLLKRVSQKDLHRYGEYSKYLLFARTSFRNAWTIAKNCLKLENDNKQCGILSKTFSRYQEILKPLEEYSILDGFLYPLSDEASDLSDEKFDSFHFDWKRLHDLLNSDQLLVPKREQKSLPSSVKTNFDYLLLLTKEFASQELGDEKLYLSLKLYRDLTRLRCEAAIYSDKTSNCKGICAAAIEEAGRLFFPKHAPQIDEQLKKKNYAGVRELLSQFNKHVGKTAAFQKRWSVIEKVQQKQQKQQQAKFQKEQQRQQQQWYRQQQQHQQQQQQQQQMRSDASKDYYKVLDILRDADDRTIKKAYRTQTLKYHPDKYKGGDLDEKGVEQKMQEINEAYEVLSNKESREIYDREREGQARGFQNRNSGGGFQFQGNPNFGFNFGNGGIRFGGNGFNFGNIKFQQAKQHQQRKQRKK